MNPFVSLIIIIITFFLLTVLLLSENNVRNNFRYFPPPRFYGRGYRRRFLNRPCLNCPRYYNKYYPQSLVDETCLNSCCDYENCIKGEGCVWKSPSGETRNGNVEECQKYNHCLENNTEKNNKDRDNECRKLIGI